MQAIICAAGKGTRMGELSKHTPKPLLDVLGKSLIEHKIDALPEKVTEVICVVNHLQELILERLGGVYNGKKITCVTDVPLTGTDTAVRACRDVVTGPFLVLMGDDLYHPKDMLEMSSMNCAILIHKEARDEALVGGKIVMNENGHIEEILEGATISTGEHVNCGMYMLPLEYFSTTPVQIPNREEYGLPQTIMGNKKNLPTISGTESRGYCQVTSPSDLPRAEDFVKKFLQ
ncbi:MAG: sugar phosphate nucleotidyltransferase [Candidatus Paceibacterota bacterium]